MTRRRSRRRRWRLRCSSPCRRWRCREGADASADHRAGGAVVGLFARTGFARAVVAGVAVAGASTQRSRLRVMAQGRSESHGVAPPLTRLSKERADGAAVPTQSARGGALVRLAQGLGLVARLGLGLEDAAGSR